MNNGLRRMNGGGKSPLGFTQLEHERTRLRHVTISPSNR
jgi:hypothetical protein